MERESQGFATTLWGRIKTRVTQSGTESKVGKQLAQGHTDWIVTEEGPYRSGPRLDQQTSGADRTSHTRAQTARA